MREKERGCDGCVLATRGTGFARTDGAGRLGVLVVAEALGEDEAREGLPLVGQTGKLFNRIVGRTFDPHLNRSLERDDFLLANVVNCRPPLNILTKASYELSAIEHCSPYLMETIRKFKPKAIIAMGNQPLRWFTGEWGIEQLRGYAFSTPYGPVVPTYHPAYIMKGKFNLTRVMQMDILKALRIAREGPESLKVQKHYQLHPSPQAFEIFIREYEGSGAPLAFDIETPYGSKDEDMGVIEDDASFTILRISFSFSPFHAITVPWTPPFIEMVKRLLFLKGEKLVWHENFDVPRLIANGVKFGGQIIDAMHAWHFLEPSLPMGLKYVSTFFCPDMPAWKLLAHKEKEWYSCADSDTLLRCYFGIKERLGAEGRWDIFRRHFVELGGMLRRISDRGIAVDSEKRRTAKDYFSGRYEETVRGTQPLIPVEVKPHHPKKGYKKSEEQLKNMKKSPWVEGEMVKIKVEVKDEVEVENVVSEEALPGSGLPTPKPARKVRGRRKGCVELADFKPQGSPGDSSMASLFDSGEVHLPALHAGKKG